MERRREFLVSFAQKARFDPLRVTNWRTKLPQLRAYGVSSPFPFTFTTEKEQDESC